MLSDIKLVLKEDAGLDINDKTKILVKGITAAEAPPREAEPDGSLDRIQLPQCHSEGLHVWNSPVARPGRTRLGDLKVTPWMI